MKRSKKVVSMAAAMVALLAIGGTFAYYTATHEIDNTMETGAYGDEMTEVFTPDSNWEPGEEADKIVGVTNTGDYDIVVRVSMSETWTDEDGEIITVASNESGFLTATTSAGDQLSATDGLVDDTDVSSLGGDESGDTDGSVVYKELFSDSSWTYNVDDGYWYYNSILESGESTTSLLSSITLAEDTDMGVYTEVISYVVTTSETLLGDETWTVLVAEDDLAGVEVEDDEYLHVKSVSTITTDYEGYADATYVLTITSETLQATDEAIATWTTAPASLDWTPAATND